MTKYAWPLPGEGSTAQEILATEVVNAIPGLKSYSLDGRRDASLAELVAASSLGQASLTINAGSYPGATNDQKVQAAITAAVAQGAKYVFVPASLLPYTASLVTFNTTVRMIREGGRADVYDWRAYGADPAAVLDATVAIQASVTAALANIGTSWGPAGLYLTSAVINAPTGAMSVTTGCSICGEGRDRTVIWQNTLPTIGTVSNSANNFDVLNIRGSNILVRDLTLRGGAGVAPAIAAGASSQGQHGMTIQELNNGSMTNVTVEDVTIEQVQTNCLQIWNGVTQVYLKNLRLTDGGLEGLLVSQLSGYVMADGIWVKQVRSWGLDTTAGRVRIKNFSVLNAGDASIPNDGGGISVNVLSTATFTDTVIFENGEVHDVIGVGCQVTVPVTVSTRATNLQFSNIVITSTNRTNSTSGFIIRNVGGTNLGTVEHVTFTACKTLNCSFGTQSASDVAFLGCQSENTINLPASDDQTTQGWRLDDSTFGPIKLIGCTSKGWRSNFWWQSGTKGMGIGNYSISPGGITNGGVNGFVYGVGMTVAITSIGEVDTGSSAGFNNNVSPLTRSVVVASFGNDGGTSLNHLSRFQQGPVVLGIATKALTDAATITPDATTGGYFTLLTTAGVGGTRQIANATNVLTGQVLTFTIIQDGTGGRAVTWGAAYKQSWSDTGNTLNKRSTISFEYDGTNFNQVGAQTPYV